VDKYTKCMKNFSFIDPLYVSVTFGHLKGGGTFDTYKVLTALYYL
jgi:hypothetical protein